MAKPPKPTPPPPLPAMPQELEQNIVQRYEASLAASKQARAESAARREQSTQIRTHCQEINLAILELRGRLGLKQAAIQTLLPFYPHPISRELRWQIDC